MNVTFVFQEFSKICHNLSSDQVTAAFAKFDISGDNKLDYKEFCAMMNRRQERKEKEKGKEREDENEKEEL